MVSEEGTKNNSMVGMSIKETPIFGFLSIIARKHDRIKSYAISQVQNRHILILINTKEHYKHFGRVLPRYNASLSKIDHFINLEL